MSRCSKEEWKELNDLKTSLEVKVKAINRENTINSILNDCEYI